MPVIFLEGIADPDGVLHQVRAIKVGAGITVTLHPDDSLVGPTGAITGYLEIAVTSDIVPTSITEPGDFPASGYFVNLQIDSAGIGGRKVGGASGSAPLLTWDGTTELIGGADADVPVLELRAQLVLISSDAAAHFRADGTSTKIGGPDGASCTLTLDNSDLVADAASSIRQRIGGDDRVVTNGTAFQVFSPDGQKWLEVTNAGIGEHGAAPVSPPPYVITYGGAQSRTLPAVPLLADVIAFVANMAADLKASGKFS